MAGIPTELSIAPTIAPSSSTGSDLHQFEQVQEFGDIITGGGGNDTFVQKLARDAIIAIAVALLAKYVAQKVFK